MSRGTLARRNNPFRCPLSRWILFNSPAFIWYYRVHYILPVWPLSFVGGLSNVLCKCCNNNNNKNPSSQHHVTLNGKVQLNRIARDDKRRLLLTGGDLAGSRWEFISTFIDVHIIIHVLELLLLLLSSRVWRRRRSRIILQQIMCVYLALDTRDHSRTPTNPPTNQEITIEDRNVACVIVWCGGVVLKHIWVGVDVNTFND